MKKTYYIAITILLSLFLTSCYSKNNTSPDINLVEYSEYIEETTYEASNDIEDVVELIDNASAECHDFSYYLLEEFEKNYEQLESLYGADYTADAFSALEEINSFLSNVSDYTWEIQESINNLSADVSHLRIFGDFH